MAHRKCRIELLGRLRVCVGEAVIDHFPTQKTAGLLAYLAQEGGKVTRESLVSILWPEADPLSGRNRLNQAVSTLRRILPSGVLGSDSKTLWLENDQIETDLAEFEAARNGSLYRGPYLEGMRDTWVVPKRIELATAYTSELTQKMVQAEGDGDAEEAANLAQRALRLDPLLEQAHAVLIRSYVKLGQPAAARQAYAHMFSVLPPEASHRAETLELITHAERMAAVGRADPFVAFQPALPSFTDPVLGREAALDEVVAHVSTPGVRCVHLFGLPGIGKTRVAVAAAARVANKFEGRVCYVTCENAETRDDLRREAVRALTRGASSDAREFDDLVVRLNPTRPFFMILDHAEHVLGREDAVRQLLYFIPGLTVLLISTTKQYAGEKVEMELGPLSLESVNGQPSEAAMLFARRYQLQRPEYTFSEPDWRVIDQIAHQVGGIPAHMEAVAARARLLTPTQISNLLNERPAELYDNHLQEVFEQLPAAERLALLRLSVLGSPVGLDTLRGLCEELTLDEIGELERAGWLNSQLDSTSASRYAVPPVFRSAILSQSSELERASAQQHLVSFCEEFAQIADAETYSDQFFDAVRRISENHSIIRQTLNHLAERQQWVDVAKLANCLGLYWRHVAAPSEGIEVLTEILKYHAAGSNLGDVQVARLHLLLGGLHRLTGDAWRAKAQYDAAWTHYQSSDDSVNRLRCMFGVAAYLHESRGYEEERAWLEDALALAVENNHLVFQAFAQQRLGHVHLSLGDDDAARESFMRSLILSQEAGAESYEAAALDAISLLDLRLGKFPQAKNQLIASLALQEKNHDYYGMTDNKVYLARAWIGMGELDRARLLLSEVMETNESGQNLRDNFMAVLAHYVVATEQWLHAAQLLGFISRAAFGGRHQSILIGPELDEMQHLVCERLGSKFEAEFGQGQIYRPRDIARIVPDMLRPGS
ncbi:MAG: hypothetical protein JNJ45_12130 [Chthonomonas sp.]|nr:hypothetical protein [Chthonomonas sp.]